MATLILVTCDSGAGHLKQEKRADRILTFIHRLVTGPVPVDGAPETFFQRRQALYESEGLFHEAWWFDVEDLDGTKPGYKRIWSRLPEVCEAYDRIELWIDPDPNAQLIMVQLLDWLGGRPKIAPRLWLKQSDSPLGRRRAGDWALPPHRIEAADLTLAHRAWSAFGASTPQPWADLRNEPDLGRLPGLHHAVDRMLRELPDGTGLGATERRILALTEKQPWWFDAERLGKDVSCRTLPKADRGPIHLMRRLTETGEHVPLSYFEVGEAICNLANAPVPALAGITEPHFTLDMDLDPARQQRFSETPVQLTDLGHRLVAQTEDWSDHNPIRRWIGGTRITNENLWRWDTMAARLSGPV